MRLTFAFLFIIIKLPAYAFINDDDFIKIDGSEKYNITSKLSRYSLGTKTINSQAAFLYYSAGKFQPVQQTNNEFINDGLVNSEKWFALPIHNTTNTSITTVLEFILSGVNAIECYEVNDIQQLNQIPSSQTTSEKVVKSLLGKSLTFNITVAPQEKTLLLIKALNKGQILYLPSNIYALSYFRKYDSYKTNFFGIFQGIFLFIIVFNLLIYISTFDKIYIFYMLYASFIGMFALNDVGAAPYNLIPLRFFSGHFYLLCGFSAWLLLMQHFLNLLKKNFIFYSLLKALIIIDLVYAFLPYLFSNLFEQNESTQTIYQSGLNILFATNIIFIIVTNVSRLSYANKLAIFYGIANIPVLLGTMIFYTNYYRITHIEFGWLNPIALGLSIETFALSFGFAYRFNLIGQEKRRLLVQVNKQQQEVTEQIIYTQENERKRIAEDLHDELGSSLAALKLQLQKTTLPDNKLSEILGIVDKASADTRNISHNLMPPQFEKTSLHNLLSNYYSKLSTESSVQFTFHRSGVNHYFAKDVELVIYRILMELTNNIIKHAQATEATVQIIYYEDHLALMVEDNGKGMKQQNGDGIGLKNMYSRVNYLNGSMQIDSNNGTTIIIQVPYKKE